MSKTTNQQLVVDREVQEREMLRKMALREERRKEDQKRFDMSKSILAQSAKGIIQQILRPNLAWSDNQKVREANKKRTELFDLFSTICLAVGISLARTTRPATSINQLSQSNEDFADGLIAQMKFDKVGRFEIIGDNVVNYTFFEDLDEVDNTPRRLFKIKKKRVKCRHIVMDAKIQPLTNCDAKFNRKARWFASHILASAHLAPYFGVITGTLIESEEEILKRWTEETEFSKALKVIRAKSGEAVAKEEQQLEEDQLTMKELVRRFMETADPAIVFGNDIVFYGWK